MPVAPVRQRDHSGTMSANEGDGVFQMARILADAPVGPAQVLSPRRPKYDPGVLGFGAPLFHRPIAAHLPSREITKAHALAQDGVTGDRASQSNFKVIRMRTEDEEIELIRARHRK